jgi:hypothetical protein
MTRKQRRYPATDSYTADDRTHAAYPQRVWRPMLLLIAWCLLSGCHNVKPDPNVGATSSRELRLDHAWGSVADGGGVLGTSTDMRTNVESEQKAIENCRSKGGKGCGVLSTYHNRCIAVIMSGESVFWAESYDQEESQKRAVSECQVSGSGECIIAYSNCTNSHPQE